MLDWDLGPFWDPNLRSRIGDLGPRFRDGVILNGATSTVPRQCNPLPASYFRLRQPQKQRAVRAAAQLKEGDPPNTVNAQDP